MKEITNLTKDLKLKDALLEKKDKIILNLENKIKDMQAEIEAGGAILQKSSTRDDNEYFLNNLNLKLSDQLNQKNTLIEEFKMKNELLDKELKAVSKSVQDIQEKFNCLQDECLFVKKQNEKLKEKVVELNSFKDQHEDYYQLIERSVNGNKLVDALNLEIRGLKFELERLNQDLESERNKASKFEVQKRSMELELFQMKATLNENEMSLSKKLNSNANELPKKQDDSSKGIALVNFDEESLYDFGKKDTQKIDKLEIYQSTTPISSSSSNYKRANSSFVFKPEEAQPNNFTSYISNNLDGNIILEKEKILVEKERIELSYKQLKLDNEYCLLKLETAHRENKSLNEKVNALNKKIKSYDDLPELNKKIKEEMNLISTMFYGLAFNVINTNVEKKTSSGSKSWIETERSKLFP